MKYSELKRRYPGLDLFRIECAIVVCCFHTTIHLLCDYGMIQHIVNSGAVFMAAFFLLSGFSLFVSSGDELLDTAAAFKNFYKKRFMSIIPMYFLAGGLFVVLDIFLRKDTILNVMRLLPITVTGTQAAFPSFNFSHTGGTWFISCILICYLAFPVLKMIIVFTKKGLHGLLFGGSAVYLCYSYYIVYQLKIPSLYSNPFFRMIEFFLGMLAAALVADLDLFKFRKHQPAVWASILGVHVIMVTAISALGRAGYGRGHYYTYCVYLLCFLALLLSYSGVEGKRFLRSKIITELSGAAYVFYLAQLFSNTICKEIMKAIPIEMNIQIISLGWAVCIAITAAMRMIQKRMDTWIKRQHN